MRQRKVIISFPEQHGSDSSLLASQKVLEGLNVRFNVKTFSQPGLTSEAFIDIYNLDRDDLEFLTTSAATWLRKQSLVQISGGYDDDITLLFSGMIMDAIPQGNPDVGLQIKGLAGVEWLSSNIQIQKEKTSTGGLIEEAARQMNYKLNMPTWLKQESELLNRPIDNFSFTGTPMTLLQTIQSMVGGFSQDKNGINISTGDGEVNVWSLRGDKYIGEKQEINKKTGMIGYPHPTGTGVNVRTLLNPTIRCGDMIHLESERVPVCNGDYFVMSINHTGELRRNEFYTTLECSHAANWQGGV